jgi:hypothetical protein
VNEDRTTPGWEGVRVQIDSGAIDTIAQKNIAKPFEMKERQMPSKGVGGTSQRAGVTVRFAWIGGVQIEIITMGIKAKSYGLRAQPLTMHPRA